jgi:succinate dehydrogenase / fumarate reductase, membrane anchor subunit
MRAIRGQAPLARARGLGSARSGSHRWWLQRVSALALAPLSVWFVISFTALINADHRTYSRWIGSPLNAVLMIVLVIVLFYHMALGLQVITEDYLHTDRIKLFAIISIQFGCLVLAIAGIVSILRMLT